MHMRKHLRPSRTFNLWDVAHHLLKFFEILDACNQKKKLLQLREIELKIYTYSRRGVFTTSFEAVIKDGSLWVDVKPVKIESEHEFSELNWVVILRSNYHRFKAEFQDSILTMKFSVATVAYNSFLKHTPVPASADAVLLLQLA